MPAAQVASLAAWLARLGNVDLFEHLAPLFGGLREAMGKELSMLARPGPFRKQPNTKSYLWDAEAPLPDEAIHTSWYELTICNDDPAFAQLIDNTVLARWARDSCCPKILAACGVEALGPSAQGQRFPTGWYWHLHQPNRRSITIAHVRSLSTETVFKALFSGDCTERQLSCVALGGREFLMGVYQRMAEHCHRQMERLANEPEEPDDSEELGPSGWDLQFSRGGRRNPHVDELDD